MSKNLHKELHLRLLEVHRKVDEVSKELYSVAGMLPTLSDSNALHEEISLRIRQVRGIVETLELTVIETAVEYGELVWKE